MQIQAIWDNLQEQISSNQLFIREKLIAHLTNKNMTEYQALLPICTEFQTFKAQLINLGKALSTITWLPTDQAEQHFSGQNTTLKDSLLAFRQEILDQQILLASSNTEGYASWISPDTLRSCLVEIDSLLCTEDNLMTMLYQFKEPELEKTMAPLQESTTSPTNERAPRQLEPIRQAFSATKTTDPAIIKNIVLEILSSTNEPIPFEVISEQVYEQIKHRLTSDDLKPIAFHPSLARWQSSLIFVRQLLVHDELLTWQKDIDLWQRNFSHEPNPTQQEADDLASTRDILLDLLPFETD